MNRKDTGIVDNYILQADISEDDDIMQPTKPPCQ